jgi:hypothetical protein
VEAAASEASERCVKNVLAPRALGIRLEPRHDRLTTLKRKDRKTNRRSVWRWIAVRSRRMHVRFVIFYCSRAEGDEDEKSDVIGNKQLITQK